MTIYLLRHGETEWNKEGRKQGRGDSPLTALGRNQALACTLTIKKHIRKSAEVSVVTSPLGRARETGEILCKELSILADQRSESPELMELDYGQWQGLTDDEIDRKFPGERQKRYGNHWTYQVPDGESNALVEKRVSNWLTLQKEERETIVIAHEMVNRVLLGLYLGLDQGETLKIKHSPTQVFQLKNKKMIKLLACVSEA